MIQKMFKFVEMKTIAWYNISYVIVISTYIIKKRKVNIMYKSKRQKNKSFDWYGLSQRFSIRKYHFGAASVLLGTALILGAAQTTAKAEEAATENKTEAVASAPKDDKESENVANVTTPALSATTEAAVAEKPTLSDEEVAKLAAEASKKDEKVAETATTEKTEAADKEKATLTAPSTDKKADKAVDEKSDKKDEKKAENPITATKTVLEQLTSEAEVLNTTASNFADKKAEDKAGKEAIATAVAAAKVQIEASKKALAAGEITKQELDAQLQRISSAIEAVYAEMKRAGHVGKVEAVLAGETTTNTAIVAPTTKTPVKNINELTEEEIAAVKREIMNANPSITDPSMIEVVNKGNGTAGGATVTINGVKTNIPSGDTVVGTAGTKNLEQLKNNINWFDFAAASITYSNGTVVGPARKLAQPITKTITYPNGDRVEGKITMVRDVTYADGSKGLTTDDKFLNSGTAKYVEHLYYTGGAQNDHELYEALQEGMKFNVKTKVEGYTLTATVIKLGSKNVDSDPNKTPAGPVNAVRDYGDWGSEKQLAKAQAEDKRFKENATKNKKTLANNPTVSVNGVALTIPEYPTETFANTDEYYSKAAAYHAAVKAYNDAIETQKLSATKLSETGFTYINVNGKAVPSGSANLYKKIGNERKADVLITAQDTQWSYLRKAGLPTTNPDGSEMLTSFTSSRDESNVGVTFALSATYNGRIVDVNVIAADAEEAGRTEIVQFETDGTKWEQFMALNLQKDIDDKTAQGVYPSRPSDVNADGRLAEAGYNPKDWVNTDEKGNPTAYGTNTFGANYTSMGSKNSLPIALSQNVKTLSMYLNSAGAQAGTIGFMIYDGGDAPQSYGSAQHIIGDFNKEVVKDGVKTQVTATQPYLGNVKGDPDFRSTKTDPSGGWVLDDLITSEKYKETPLESGKTVVTTDKGVTGKYLLLPNGNAVIEKSDNTRVLLNQGDVIEMVNPSTKLPIRGVYNHTTGALGEGTLGDEGESQLLDPAVATEYKLRQAQGNEYVLEGVRANLGVNNDKAYVRGWVDFNNNGKFDLNESSEIVEVNKNGTYNIKFKNTPQLLDTSADSLGVRLRISLTKDEILEPTGVASSGEVEDFETHVIHMPRGTKHETKDFQGREQTVKLPTNAMFTASGKNKDSKYKQWAQIENESLPPKIVLTDKQVASEEAYTPTDSELPSNYRKGDDGKVFVERNGATVFTGEYVTVKDKNNKVLGKGLKITNPLNNKTEYLLDTYTEYDTAGNEVGTYKVNPASNGKNVSIGNGLYETTLTFKPVDAYVGTAKGIAVRAWDDNNSSTGWEATNDTIETSKTSTTLAEKDKVLENTNNGNNGYKSMDTSYIPTVIDVRPVGEDTITEDVQGKPQSSNPTIPAYATVETVTNDKIEDVKYTANFAILDKTKKPTLALQKEIPGKVYTEDTKVDKETEVTLPNGKTATFKPADKIPANTRIAETEAVTVNGTGDVLVSNVRYGTGSVPAGAILEGAEPTVTEPTTVLRNGANVVIPVGGKVQRGDQLVTPLKIAGGAQITTWKKTYQNGETIPKVTADKFSVLGKETSVDQLVPKGESITLNGTTYNANNDIVPKGSREATTYENLMGSKLPNAVHIDPETGEVTSVPRRYTKVTDTEIVIENEGTYTLNQDSGEITFTPHPKFVGTGTGVTKQQPDIDYNDKVAGDPVTSKYGTDYGKATYTPIVKPQSKASITRTIHYVYENADDNPTSQDSYKDNDPIVAIDNTPVTRTQTIDYTRDYQIFTEAGATDKEIITTNQVTDAAGTTYKVGQTIPKGTKFNQGTIIIGKWTASSADNSKFKEIISPTVKGYTAEVVTADFTPRADGKMGHIHNNKQPVGIYTPVENNTKDVGAYEPLVSEVTSDDTDNFDMYVVYKADTQKAKVTYIDLDATGDNRILEVQTAATAPATGADAKTTYGVTTLQGKSHTAIPYTTAETIKKYEDLGYELVTDDYTNNTQGTAIEGGRKFDDDKEVDQAFNVYLRHKKVTRKIKDTQEVTRTIEYKYASTDDVPADKRGTTAAPTVTETLHFERDRTIDYTLAAKEYPTEYAAYKAILDKSGYDSPEEYQARVVYYDHITNKAIAADATDVQKSIVTFGPWTPVGGTSNDAITLSDAEKAKDDKFNLVNSPEVTGYVPDNATVEATAAIDAEADDYKITVLYTPVAQKAVVKFVEVDPTNTNKVITPGLADPIAVTGKSEAAYPATTATSVTDKIAELVKKGYELVENGFVATDKFDKDGAVDQEYVVKFKAKVVDIPSFDPTKPASNENPKPTPGVTPIDPNNPDGPKWTEALINAVKVQEEVTRTIKYVYEDGTPVAESDLTSVADKKVKTLKFTRSGKINVATGEITYGDWSADQTFEAVTSPTLEKYTAAVAGVTPTVADVPAKTVAATDKDFEETVIYSTKPTTVDPNKPTDPTNPNVTPQPDDVVPNDPKGRTYRELGLVEEVTHTVHYKLEDGSDAGIADNVQTLTFTRTAEVDPVTGAISNYGTWKAKGGDTTIDAVTTPNKDGYVASAKTSTERTNVAATDKDSEETIIYRKLGSYVPVIPEGVTPPAGTDLTPKPYETPTNEDPTKPGTPTETPVVPYIPGTTPVGPDGKPLTPKDPNDPTKGYEVPKVPEDPTQNTTITYVKDGSQVALVHFIKADGTAVHVSVAEAGDTGKAIKTTNIDNVKAELEAKGYEVIAPTDAAYTTDRVAFYAESNRTFDDKDDKGNDGISQVYYVIVKEGITPIDPDKPLDPNIPDVTPKPGDKVPGDPKQRTYEQLGLLDEVNRTINYRYANTDKVEEAKRGQEARPTVEQKLRYSRKGDLNKVTGEITYTSDWTAPQTLAEVTSPVIEGYVADIKAAEKVENVAHDAADSVVNVVYSPLGKYVPKVPEGFEVPKVEKPQYPNDPTDPTKPGTPTTVIPYVPGTTPKDPNGNPLKPVDPNDPSKGYVPPTPENPTEDTQITYEKETQKAKVTYVVEGTGTVLHTDNLEGKSGEPIKYSTVAKLTELKALGYDLVTDGFTTATDKNYDKDTKVDQNFVVTVTPHVEPIKPVDPENPNDPNKPKPGDPIDPKNPDGPKWTEDLIKKIDTTRHVNRTITYVNEKGEEVAEKVTDKVTFTREAKLNAVTGEITYGDWTAKDGDTTFDKVESPVVKGYILKDAKQKEVAATTGLTADSKDENIEVVYTKLGSWVPKVPEGVTPIDPIPYPNDPKDPTKPGSDRPIVPYVPGTTPVVPKDPTKPISPDNPLVPLTPVDPNDPTKGYEVPPVPTDPSVDTPITYVTDKQKAITNFVTETGKVVSTPVVDEGDSGANFTKSKVDEVTKTIEKLEKAGYRVVKNEFPSKDTDRVFDKDKSVDQIFTVTVAERIIPVTPGKPVDPNDPNLPKNPDGTPVTPSTPEPGKPVFPNDPNSPVWPSTVKDLVTEKSATRTIKYVDRNGKEVSETRTETIKFTREAKVNLVTGEITYGEWTTDRNDDIFNGYPVPVVKGYIAKDGDLESSTKDVKVTPDTIKDINETVVYDKLGSWVPNIPGTPTNPIPYPNDPKDPAKPGSDKPHVPYVPGFTPVDPNGNPLKPVDPNDPTKGYEVPNVPNDPTKETPINYVPVPQPTPVTPEAPAVPKAPTQVKRLANTGTTETNTGLAGLGMAIFGGLLAAARRRKNKED